ncbi:L-idonate 5-dehydrogenase [Brucella endophytica]|uniref:L-idonate 5-dehydrogenase n=1 Tax=Brucella endophytica TaxID=1963359 RepID=UPI001662FD94|nr:L-idonate 5-dehydrogenase [Brucella endophytica]
MLTKIVRLYGKYDLHVETQECPEPDAGEVRLKMARGGICGSDLHYFQDGGFGPVRVREPVISGHEASGFVEAVGPGVNGFRTGMLVAVNPSQPCGHCHYCSAGLPIHCLDMKFMGSAMRLPHEQGLFREYLVVPAIQCFPIDGDVSAAEAACAEPLAVCLHAVAQAGDLSGKNVLVTGAGPIGLLVVAAARHAGAGLITVTDIADAALSRGLAMGAGETVNVSGLDPLARYRKDKGTFDIVFECSAAGPALVSAFDAVKPRGTIVQVGVTGEVPVPVNLLVGKEIVWRGSQRFHEEFAQAVELIGSRAIDVRPILSHTFPLDEALDAFLQAGDRTAACKVQIALS